MLPSKLCEWVEFLCGRCGNRGRGQGKQEGIGLKNVVVEIGSIIYFKLHVFPHFLGLCGMKTSVDYSTVATSTQL